MTFASLMQIVQYKVRPLMPADPSCFTLDVDLSGANTLTLKASALVFAMLIAIHIAAALKHLVVDKDGVFQRMLLK